MSLAQANEDKVIAEDFKVTGTEGFEKLTETSGCSFNLDYLQKGRVMD